MGNLFHEVMPQRKLSDLILPDEVQQICQSLIQEQHRTDLLRSYNLEPRNRVLLIGPPGNGKTSLAEAIAEALVVPLLVVRYESVVGTYLGETAVRLKKLFEYASTRKCVLFFDEFETLGKERGDLHETGEIKRVVSTLLLQIDRLPAHVVVVCSTNHSELLDRAAYGTIVIPADALPARKAPIFDWLATWSHQVRLTVIVPPGTRLAAVLPESLLTGTTIIPIPTLAERRSELGELAAHLRNDVCIRLGRMDLDLTPPDLRAIEARAWPENFRELEAYVERLLALRAFPKQAHAAKWLGVVPSTLVAWKHKYGVE